MSMDRERSKDAGYPVWGPFVRGDEQVLVWIGYPDADTIVTESVRVEVSGEYVKEKDADHA